MKRQFREATPQTKAKQSAKKSGVLNPMSGKKHKESSKKLISEKLIAYWRTVPSKNNSINNKEL